MKGPIAEALVELEAENEQLKQQLAAERAKVALAVEALKPFADCVCNDNGDITVSYSRLSTGDWLRACRKFDAMQSADALADIRREVARECAEIADDIARNLHLWNQIRTGGSMAADVIRAKFGVTA